MKTNEIFHLWAHQAKPEAKSGNVRFQGVELYSYGAVIATMIDGVVVLADRTYSVTTSKHQNAARQALTGEQREKCIYAPEIGSRNRSELVKSCQTAVQVAIASMTGKRQGSGPMIQAFQLAKRYERAGKFLGTWSLPALPETMPEDVKPLIKEIAYWQLMAEYKTTRSETERNLAWLKSEAESPYCEHNYNLPIYPARINAVKCGFNRMQNSYKTAKGKNPPMRGLQVKLAQAEEVLLPRVKRFSEQEAAKELKNALRNVYIHRNRRWLDGYAYTLERVVVALPDDQKLRYGKLVQRVKSRVAYLVSEAYFSSAKDALVLFKASPSLRTLNTIRNALNSITHPKSIAKHKPGIESITSQEAELRVGFLKQQEAANAEALRAWLGGANVRLSLDLPTYARIVGDTVETSKGAKVPVEHAKQLARLYRITVRQGGASWGDGSGPKVGFYRVNKIGADGTLVIGCHDFSAEEAGRLYDMLTWEVEAA